VRRTAPPLALCALALLVAGCGSGSKSGATVVTTPDVFKGQPTRPIDERVVRGGELYVTDGCHACHSTDGSRGGGATFRDLAAHRSDAQIVRGIAHHIALTPPSPALVALAHRRADVRALADFIETISATN
jgi:mono/diheme cytochrome c family protein